MRGFYFAGLSEFEVKPGDSSAAIENMKDAGATIIDSKSLA